MKQAQAAPAARQQAPPSPLRTPPAAPVWTAGNQAVGLMIQRKPAEEPAAEPEPTKDKAAAAGLIAEDEAKELQPGQMKKSVFLAELSKRVCATAEEALAGTIFSSVGCPWIDKWFSFYAARDAAHVETAIRKYAPEAAAARSAREYIPAVAGRVRRGIETWSRTGEVTGVPPEMQGEAPSLTAGSLIGAAISGIGRMLFKGRNGDAPRSASPRTVAARLGPGHPLDGGVRARLGGALGADVTGARIHNDGAAAELASDLNARAFTVGHHVAFAAGEYQPGTLVGDALIAHELAHVAQQQSVASSASYQALEEEADTAAVTAIAASRGVQAPSPGLSRSGLRLQRCAGGPSATPQSQYDKYLLEGSDKLRGIGFGMPWGEFCEIESSKKNTDRPGYDKDFWEKKSDPVTGCKLVLKSPPANPADAIEALFNPDKKKLWLVDCGQFVQLAHYYALLKTKGRDEFNRMIGPNMELKQLFSTGLKTKTLWGRSAKNDPMSQLERKPGRKEGTPIPGAPSRPFDDVLESAPFGSRVVFANGFVAIIPTAVPGAYFHENTMKVGRDAYVAHPFERGLIKKSNIFTSAEIMDFMVEGIDSEYRKRAREEVFISEIEIYDLP